MQTWWVFYIFIYCLIIYLLLNMYFLLYFNYLMSRPSANQIFNKTKCLFILLISNKQGHIHTHHAYIHTHLLFFCLVHPQIGLFNNILFLLLFLILSIWKWECCVGYILMVWHFLWLNRIGKQMNVNLYSIHATLFVFFL